MVSVEAYVLRARLLPNVRLATTTLAPFCAAPQASDLPAPPAPKTTNSLPAKGEPDAGFGPFRPVKRRTLP